MRRIYVTHCSRAKDNSLKGTNLTTTPDKLYTAGFIRRLAQRCEAAGVDWAIFSDQYGVVFPSDRIAWYEKSPNDVTEAEYQGLLNNFISKLSVYDEILFYHNPGRFHRLYKRLIQDAQKNGLRVILISHVANIG